MQDMTRFILFLLLIFLCTPSYAQIDFSTQKDGEVVKKPICTYLTNRSSQTIMGSIAVMPQKTADGRTVTLEENYRLEAGERHKICALGPFYEGRRVSLVIRTLLPLFECKTKIDREIFLDAKEGAGGFKKLSATCS